VVLAVLAVLVAMVRARWATRFGRVIPR
jgi:hypothetical protein